MHSKLVSQERALKASVKAGDRIRELDLSKIRVQSKFNPHCTVSHKEFIFGRTAL